ncbi:sensor histidine kinase [Sphingobacterium mizutaii]|uniref:sensor histidine kinase n=1 Tax=Sphingobacterium mizutaii TaxID=1010 RepID=UPI001627EDE7|nr:sensor histidine kinase [Sphingobacterium mizutaii]
MKPFLRSIILAVIISLAIYSSIAIYVLFHTGSLEMSFIKAPESIAGISYGIFLFLSGSSSSRILNHFIPDKTKVFNRVFGFIILTCIQAPIVIFIINMLISKLMLNKTFSEFVSDENWFAYIPLTIISILIGLGFYAFYYFKQFKNKQIAQQKKIAGEATAQLESLKNQIDPHFLFNSLNVLIGLIEEDQKNAIAYTKSLSKIYRYILEHKDKEYVSIKQELEFANNYISLLQIRFEDAIEYKMEVQNLQENEFTVPLALQLLLENCIQHNKATEQNPLKIKIFQEGDLLVVENNLQEKENKSSSTKVGLKNIRERYLLTSKKDIQIIKSEEKFTVKLPILVS